MYARKAAATLERIIADTRHAVRDRHTPQSAAALERITADTRHAVRNYQISYNLTIQIEIVRIIQRI